MVSNYLEDTILAEEICNMEDYISELIQIGLGNVIDLSFDTYIVKDEVYQENMKNAGQTVEETNVSAGAETVKEQTNENS